MDRFSLSPDEWARVEAPLRSLDPVLEEFARAKQVRLTRNARDTAERSLEWGARPAALIQVFVEHAATPSYTLWVSAHDDRSRSEYWKHHTLLKAVRAQELEAQLPGLLERAYEIGSRWCAEYVSPA